MKISEEAQIKQAQIKLKEQDQRFFIADVRQLVSQKQNPYFKPRIEKMEKLNGEGRIAEAHTIAQELYALVRAK